MTFFTLIFVTVFTVNFNGYISKSVHPLQGVDTSEDCRDPPPCRQEKLGRYEESEEAETCGYNYKVKAYYMFATRCHMKYIARCLNIELIETPIIYCVKAMYMYNKNITRRNFEESCPVFCPKHYRPVCGASKLRDYKYRGFVNGCHLDLLNCRGPEDEGYVEVPLSFCQNHAMMNVWGQDVMLVSHV